EVGLDGVPSPNQHGGVRVYGQVVRRTQINLVRLRALAVTRRDDQSNIVIDKDATLTLRRYVLGLSLVAARIQERYDLRIGCLLRSVTSESKVVHSSGKPDEDFPWDKGTVFAYAAKAAEIFRVGDDKKTIFGKDLAIKARAKAEKDK